jgi:hypothetical protein
MSDEITFFSWVLLLCIETAAFVAGCVGVLCTSERGGRVMGMMYGIPVILLAVIPPILMWSASGRSLWWYCPFVASLFPGFLCIWYGFHRRKQTTKGGQG